MRKLTHEATQLIRTGAVTQQDSDTCALFLCRRVKQSGDAITCANDNLEFLRLGLHYSETASVNQVFEL